MGEEEEEVEEKRSSIILEGKDIEEGERQVGHERGKGGGGAEGGRRKEKGKHETFSAKHTQR